MGRQFRFLGLPEVFWWVVMGVVLIGFMWLCYVFSGIMPLYVPIGWTAILLGFARPMWNSLGPLGPLSRKESHVGDQPDYTRQPPPAVIEGAVSSHDLACADLANWGDGPMVEPAIGFLAERKRYGLNKYGVVLHVDNERSHVQDAIDEAADLTVYLRTMLDERPEIRGYLTPLYRDTLWTLVCLLAVRDDRRLPDRYEQRMGPLVEIDELREGMEINVQ